MSAVNDLGHARADLAGALGCVRQARASVLAAGRDDTMLARLEGEIRKVQEWLVTEMAMEAG